MDNLINDWVGVLAKLLQFLADNPSTYQPDTLKNIEYQSVSTCCIVTGTKVGQLVTVAMNISPVDGTPMNTAQFFDRGAVFMPSPPKAKGNATEDAQSTDNQPLEAGYVMYWTIEAEAIIGRVVKISYKNSGEESFLVTKSRVYLLVL